jgi:rare lipoprotein A
MRRGAAVMLAAALALASGTGQAEPVEQGEPLQPAAPWPEAKPVQEVPAAPPEGRVKARLRSVGKGLASWYGAAFHGRRTASGELFDMHALTAAHPSLPFGTIVTVYSLTNGSSVQVRINDRGPFTANRVIDLSRAAAAKLGLIDRGTKAVELHLGEGKEPAAPAAGAGMPDRVFNRQPE